MASPNLDVDGGRARAYGRVDETGDDPPTPLGPARLRPIDRTRNLPARGSGRVARRPPRREGAPRHAARHGDRPRGRGAPRRLRAWLAREGAGAPGGRSPLGARAGRLRRVRGAARLPARAPDAPRAGGRGRTFSTASRSHAQGGHLRSGWRRGLLDPEPRRPRARNPPRARPTRRATPPLAVPLDSDARTRGDRHPVGRPRGPHRHRRPLALTGTRRPAP